MAQLIAASRLADVAQQVLSEYPNMPFKQGGTTPKDGMDAGGFIHYCLKQLGINVTSRGTNSLYRQIGAGAIPLAEAKKRNLVGPGVVLFYVDERGSAEYALICLDAEWAVYPSKQKEKIYRTRTNMAPGRANIAAFVPGLDYGFSTAPQPPTPPVNPHREILKQMVVIGDKKLQMREAPGGKYMLQMPPGSVVDVHEIRNDWAYLTYYGFKIPKTGWAMLKFLADHHASNA